MGEELVSFFARGKRGAAVNVWILPVLVLLKVENFGLKNGKLEEMLNWRWPGPENGENLK